MPDPFERHARPNGWGDDWGPRPPRSQQRAAAAVGQLHPEIVPQGQRPPGRKDPDLCKAAHWKGPHQPRFRMRRYGWNPRSSCGWGLLWSRAERCRTAGWACLHEESCSGCGKIIRDRIPYAECPDFRPITAAERAVIDAERARERTAAERSRWQPKPPVTGPQGYRRPRASRG